MNRRAFIATAFSGLAAAALGMPTQLRGPVVSPRTRWLLSKVEPMRLPPRIFSVSWQDSFPRRCHDDEVDVFMLPGERILTAVEVGEDRGRELEELNRKPGRLANLHLRGCDADS